MEHGKDEQKYVKFNLFCITEQNGMRPLSEVETNLKASCQKGPQIIFYGLVAVSGDEGCWLESVAMYVVCMWDSRATVHYFPP
jgi:hypothetical protein